MFFHYSSSLLHCDRAQVRSGGTCPVVPAAPAEAEAEKGGFLPGMAGKCPNGQASPGGTALCPWHPEYSTPNPQWLRQILGMSHPD